MIIYTIRHGETDWNRARRVQGSTDIPLNKEGIKQAQNAAEYFKNAHIQKIYTSDLTRAKQTAQELSKILGVQAVVSTPLLREMDCGDAECLSFAEIEHLPDIKAVFEEFDNGNVDAHFPNGESQRSVARRMMDFLKTLPTDEGNVLLVSHGGVLRSFLIVYGGMDRHIPNCGGMRFEWNPKNGLSNVEIYSTGDTLTLF